MIEVVTNVVNIQVVEDKVKNVVKVVNKIINKKVVVVNVGIEKDLDVATFFKNLV